MGDWKILDTGGTAKDLEDDYNIKVQQAYGVGMPPIRNVVTPYGLVDGGKFQRSIALPREFTLECVVPNVASTTKASHHTAKKNLIELVKRDRQTTEGPVTVRYTGATSDVQLQAYYVSGLEGGEVTGNVEKFSMQMIAPDPYWKETSLNGGTALAPGTAITANHAIRSTGAGQWANFGTGGGTVSNSVHAIAEDADNIYIGGLFTTWDGGTVNNIVRYDKDNETFHDLGSGGTVGVNGQVTALSIDSGGTVWIGGSFTTAGTAAIPYFTSYHESGDTFTDYSYSASGTIVTALGVTSDDTKYIGTTGDLLMSYDGSFNILGGSTGKTCYAISVDANDVVSIGGNWTADVADGSNYFAQYDHNESAFKSLGVDAPDVVRSLADGGDSSTVYIGTVQTDNAVGGSVLKWNGSELETITTTDVSASLGIYSMAYDSDLSRLYIGGYYVSIDNGNITQRTAIYSLSLAAWDNLEVTLTNINIVYAINYYSADTSLCFGYSQTAVVAATIPKTTAVSNTGTASAYPIITLAGPGAVIKVENITTGDKLQFSSLTLASGETMTIDLSPAAKTISTTLRASLISYLTSSSNLSTFNLLPGSNTISLQTDSTASGTIDWYDTHWSIYGAQ